jgi:hypothetical protein
MYGFLKEFLNACELRTTIDWVCGHKNIQDFPNIEVELSGSVIYW